MLSGASLRLSRKTSMSAGSSMTGPREILMSLADGFIACGSAAPTKPFVL
jgi:hypothetical protein